MLTIKIYLYIYIYVYLEELATCNTGYYGNIYIYKGNVTMRLCYKKYTLSSYFFFHFSVNKKKTIYATHIKQSYTSYTGIKPNKINLT